VGERADRQAAGRAREIHSPSLSLSFVHEAETSKAGQAAICVAGIAVTGRRARADDRKRKVEKQAARQAGRQAGRQAHSRQEHISRCFLIAVGSSQEMLLELSARACDRE
jgi:hypothetical protein